MPKEFITEKDIEDLVKRGATSLETGDHVVLTQLAYEKAARLGVRLVSGKPDNPPVAPIRPYLSQKQGPPEPVAAVAGCGCAGQSCGSVPSPASVTSGDVHRRVHEAVVARLGNQVDSNLLDVIIKRVLQNTGVK
jgi:hypothetical protein